MTPEGIIKNFIEARLDACDDIDMLNAKLKAIEAIKQYAREMCDKQKMWCNIEYCKVPNTDITENSVAISYAPYPKELQ